MNFPAENPNFGYSQFDAYEKDRVEDKNSLFGISQSNLDLLGENTKLVESAFDDDKFPSVRDYLASSWIDLSSHALHLVPMVINAADAHNTGRQLAVSDTRPYVKHIYPLLQALIKTGQMPQIEGDHLSKAYGALSKVNRAKATLEGMAGLSAFGLGWWITHEPGYGCLTALPIITAMAGAGKVIDGIVEKKIAEQLQVHMSEILDVVRSQIVMNQPLIEKKVLPELYKHPYPKQEIMGEWSMILDAVLPVGSHPINLNQYFLSRLNEVPKLINYYKKDFPVLSELFERLPGNINLPDEAGIIAASLFGSIAILAGRDQEPAIKNKWRKIQEQAPFQRELATLPGASLLSGIDINRLEEGMHNVSYCLRDLIPENSACIIADYIRFKKALRVV